MRRQSLPWHRGTTSPEFPATGEPVTTSAVTPGGGLYLLPANRCFNVATCYCLCICPADPGCCMPSRYVVPTLHSASVAILYPVGLSSIS